MKKITFYFASIVLVISRICSGYAMDTAGAVDVIFDEGRHRLAAEIYAPLEGREDLNHVNFDIKLEDIINKVRKRGSAEEYVECMDLKRKSAYQLPPAYFPEGELFSIEQVQKALETLGVLNLDEGFCERFLDFFLAEIEVPDPLFPSSCNIIDAYIEQGQKIRTALENKIAEECSLLSQLASELEDCEDYNPDSPMSNFREQRDDISEFIRQNGGHATFPIEDVIDIFNGNGVPVSHLAHLTVKLGPLNFFERLCVGLKKGKGKSYSLYGENMGINIAKLQANQDIFRSQFLELVGSLLAKQFSHLLYTIILEDNLRVDLTPKANEASLLYPVFGRAEHQRVKADSDPLDEATINQEILRLQSEFASSTQFYENLLEHYSQEVTEGKEKARQLEILLNQVMEAQAEQGSIQAAIAEKESSCEDTAEEQSKLIELKENINQYLKEILHWKEIAAEEAEKRVKQKKKEDALLQRLNKKEVEIRELAAQLGKHEAVSRFNPWAPKGRAASPLSFTDIETTRAGLGVAIRSGRHETPRSFNFPPIRDSDAS